MQENNTQPADVELEQLEQTIAFFREQHQRVVRWNNDGVLALLTTVPRCQFRASIDALAAAIDNKIQALEAQAYRASKRLRASQ